VTVPPGGYYIRELGVSVVESGDSSMLSDLQEFVRRKVQIRSSHGGNSIDFDQGTMPFRD
jgi:hypothetical protein